jgi:osmotically-inducible protein OsmY
VKAVANQLEVELPTSTPRTDEDIARAAKQGLDWSPEVPDSVKAAVDDGWITLHGEVEWHYQKQAAERAVRDLPGVKGVIKPD